MPKRVRRYDVQLTSPDTVYFPEPGSTKGGLVRYSLEVADCVLPHIQVGPKAFKLQTMPARVKKVGDLNAGMWRRKVSLGPRFERLGLEAPQP